MAYNKIAFSTLEQLVDSLYVIAKDNGWTVDAFGAFRGGLRLSVHNSRGCYLHFYSANDIMVGSLDSAPNGVYTAKRITGIALNGSTGFDASKDPLWQPGVTAGGELPVTGRYKDVFHISMPTAGIAHLIATPDSLFAFVETSDAVMEVGYAQHETLSGGLLGTIHAPNNNLSYLKLGSAQPGSNVSFDGTKWAWAFRCYTYLDNSSLVVDNFLSHMGNSPSVSSTLNIDFYSTTKAASPSGALGVRPIYPFFVVKRVGPILYPVVISGSMGYINANGLPVASLFETSAGTYLVCRPTPFYNTNPANAALARHDMAFLT